MSKLEYRTQTTKGYRLRGIGTLFVLILMVALTLWQAQPPSPVAASAPATDFSAERAAKIIADIAQKPHPTGSPENARVRQYLIDQLKSMGLTPETETGTAEVGQNFPNVATVTNVMARLKGTDSSKAVLLMAHYDSVPTGPGASDDGASVAAELETLRALKSGPPLKNDVIFLFTDGEELGTLGAQVFWNNHPWRNDVGVVLNFEARGSSGASLMFQTSDQNGWLIDQFAQAGTHPVSNSIMGDLYRRMPNGTDLTISNAKQFSGLNFAFGDNWPAYHTALDNVADVDHASLQHQGDNALKLVRQFGNADLTNTKAPDAEYFNLFGLLVHYPESWVLPIAIVVALLFFATLFIGVRKRELSLKKVLLGLLVVLLAVIVAPAVVYGLWTLVQALWAGTMFAPMGGLFDNELYEVGFVTLTLAITALLLNRFKKRLGLLNLLGSGMLFWTLLMLAVSVLLPGAGYLFTWPLLISVITYGVALASNDPEATLEHPISLLVTMLPVVFFLTSLISLLFIFLPVTINVFVMVLVVLGLALLLPQFSVLMESGKKWVPSLAALTTIVLLIVSAVTAHHDSKQPLANSISYYLNTDTNKSSWVSWSNQTDSYLSQFLQHPQKESVDQALPLGLSTRKVLTDTAPTVALRPPMVRLQSEQTGAGGTRILHLTVDSERQAGQFLIEITDPNVQQVSFDGTPIKRNDPSVPWDFEYTTMPSGQLSLDIVSKSGDKVKLLVSDVTDGLPSTGQTYKPRPDTMMPGPNFDQQTIVSKSYEF